MLSIISIECVAKKIYRVWFENNDGVTLLTHPIEMSVRDWRKLREALRSRKIFESKDKIVTVSDARMITIEIPIEGTKRKITWSQHVADNIEVFCHAAHRVQDMYNS